MAYAAQQSPPAAASAGAQAESAKKNDPKQQLRGLPFDEQEKLLSPPAEGDNVMFDPTQHMGAMAEEPRGPDSVRDPAKLDHARLGALKRQLETEHADNASLSRKLTPEIEEIDKKLETATGEEKTQLEDKRKALSKQLKTAEDAYMKAHADLELMNDPTAAPAAVNDMLARRQTALVAQPESKDKTATSGIDAKKGAFASETDTHNKMTEDGGSQTKKDTKALEVGLTGGSYARTKEDKTIQGDTTVTKTDAAEHALDLKEGTYTRKKTDGELKEDTSGKSGTQTKTATAIGASGVSRSKEVEVTKGEDKTKDKSSIGVERGDGKIGISKGSSASVEKGDGSGSSRDAKVSGGVIAGKDGVGAYGNAEESGTKKFASGLSVTGKVAAGGRAVYNITPVPDSDPVKYQITLTINLDGSLGGGVGGEKGKETKGNVKASVSGSAAVQASFSRELDEAGTKAWKEKLAQAEQGVGGGDREFQIISTGMSKGWGDARKIYDGFSQGTLAEGLGEGEARGISAELKGGGNLEAGGESGNLSLGAGGGYEKSKKVEGEVRRSKDKTTTSLEITDGESKSASGKGGYGIASMSLGGKWSTTTAFGFKIVVADSYPNAAAVRAEAETIRTQAQLDDFRKRHPTCVQEQSKTAGSGKDVTTGADVGPLGVKMTAGGSVTDKRTDEYDEKGELKSKTAAMSGESHLGGEATLGPLKMGSSSKEELATKVKTEKDEKGNWKQTASGDMSKTDTESGTDLLATIDGLGDAKPLGVLTGSQKVLKEKEKKDVAGFFMDDDDFNAVMARAKDPNAWSKGFSRVANMEDWEKCRREIVAAGSDKEKVAAALAKFAGGGEHGRSTNLAELLKVDQGGGGDRYEFPSKLGDQRSAYLSLVVNNPMAAVDELVGQKKIAEAAKKANELAQQVASLQIRLTNNRNEFKDQNVYGEMITRTGKRETELSLRAKVLAAEAAGKEVKPETLERATAAEEFNRLMGVCREFKEAEQRNFSKIDANHKAWMGNHNEAENVKYVNELRANVKIWEPQYEQMMQLADLHGFTGGGGAFKGWKPDKVRLEMAYKGKNPMSDEAMTAQDDADFRGKLADESGKEASKRALDSMTLTAGMKRQADGSYYREYSNEEKAAKEKELYADLRPKVDADLKTREGKVASGRAEATQAKGKCNMLTSAGNWDKVKPAAKVPYNQGYALYNTAEKSWKAALQASKATNLKGLSLYFGNAQNAVSEFRDCVDSFKKGDALQG